MIQIILYGLILSMAVFTLKGIVFSGPQDTSRSF